MSSSGHPVIVARDFQLTAGTRFPVHRHATHQLTWAAKGVVSVTAPGGVWVLPATRALWIPAGTPHALEGGPAVARAVYVDRAPRGFHTPTVVVVTPLLRELAAHLATFPPLPAAASASALDAAFAGPVRSSAAARRRAEAVLLDLLQPAGVATIDVPMPADPRALLVAEAVAARPSDGRDLDGWARHAGASARTLARLFTDGTGMSFGRWRTNVRLRAALSLLATGTPVAVVARRVGYRSPSAFIAAFRQAFGVSPGAYFSL
ncbi:helix-turn-helix transcriptional regulator [Dactylosporangium maewongense]|uniref:AraC family transcriptional regulator n=1 Tax=Dactylosporangium maewongense TaxID=634393 RepID=UPI0031DB01E0